jgi:hypothetical protein
MVIMTKYRDAQLYGVPYNTLKRLSEVRRKISWLLSLGKILAAPTHHYKNCPKN